MDDDSRVTDKGWDTLPGYAEKSGDDDATVSISTTPGEWLANTADAVVVPMSMVEVVEALRAHKLTERSLVWRQGMQEWAPIRQVPQLMLAARLPASPSPDTRGPSAAPRPSKPPPKPATRLRTPLPQVGLSRRSTLPFGLPAPSGVSQPRRPSTPSAAPPPASEEPVLAVYERPTATVSFDLSPSEPRRAPARASVPPPHTLVPTTSDAPVTRESTSSPAAATDPSSVTASQLRALRRSSKRLLVLSSVASAAAASLLTFWIARLTPAQPVATAPIAGAALTAKPPEPAPAPPAAEPIASAPGASVEPSGEPGAKAAPPIAAALRPIARKPKVATLETSAPEANNTGETAARPPAHDVKLQEERPAEAPKPPRPVSPFDPAAWSSAATSRDGEASTATGPGSSDL